MFVDLCDLDRESWQRIRACLLFVAVATSTVLKLCSYYVHPPAELSEKSLILILAEEFKALLAEIEEELYIRVSIDKDSEQSGLLISFLDDGTPQPRYLGVSTSRNAYDDLVQKASTMGPKGSELLAGPHDDRSLAAWRAKMGLYLQAMRGKSAKLKAKRAEEKLDKKASKYARAESLAT